MNDPNTFAPDPASSPLKTNDVPGGTETILVVEDEEIVATRVTRLLVQKGYTVFTARGGEEAQRIFRDHPEIALVLTDVIMPGMNGKQLVESLQKTVSSLRVIYMSGYPAEVIGEKGILGEKTTFIEKPFYSARLLSKIREILDA